jgi:hypothetical protein
MMRFKTVILRVLNRPGGRLTTYADRHRIAALLSIVPLPLPRILSLFGSDKQSTGEHAYGQTYGRLFAPFRYRRIKILEIGVLAGASLLAWRAYFPRAVTTGMDIDDKSDFAIGPRTLFFRGDQGSNDDLCRLCNGGRTFDIVIDDGSHQCHHQIFTFRALFNKVSDGGLYIIEDVQTSFWPTEVRGCTWGGRDITDPAFAETCYGWFLDLAKYVNHAEFFRQDGLDKEKLAFARDIRRISFEHNIIVVEKGANRDPSNYLNSDQALPTTRIGGYSLRKRSGSRLG